MPTYPATLPKPSLSMSGSESRPVIGTQMEGRNRQRRRWTGKKEEYNVQFLFNETELPIFEAFLDTDLAGGVLFFDIDLPIDGAVATKSVRFKDGILRKQYRPHLNWTYTGIIEVEIAQSENDPDQTFQALYFQPEFIITEDTLLGEQHRNALLRVQGVTSSTPIVLSILFGDEAAEYMPVGIQHEGADGDVILRMLEDGDDGVTVDPFTLATQLGLHIYSFADAAYYTNDPGGSCDVLLDQNSNEPADQNSLRATDDSRKATVVGTVLQVRSTGNKSFEGWADEPTSTTGKGCFIVVANMNTNQSRTCFCHGPSNDRPKLNYNPSNGTWQYTWGPGGPDSDSGTGGPDTENRIALYMVYTPTGTAAPKFYIDGEDQLLNAADTGAFPNQWWDATIFGKDDVNESVGLDMDVYELFIGGIGTGDDGEGLTEIQFLELAEAIADSHGVTWLG